MRTLVWMFGFKFLYWVVLDFAYIFILYMLVTLQIYFINAHYYLLVFAVYLFNLSDATGT
jgi:hypothetical protein